MFVPTFNSFGFLGGKTKSGEITTACKREMVEARAELPMPTELMVNLTCGVEIVYELST